VIKQLKGDINDLQREEVKVPAVQIGEVNYPVAQYPGAQYPVVMQPVAQYPGVVYPEAQYPGAQYHGAQYPGAQYPGAIQPGAQYPGVIYPDVGYNAHLPIIDQPVQPKQSQGITKDKIDSSTNLKKNSKKDSKKDRNESISNLLSKSRATSEHKGEVKSIHKIVKREVNKLLVEKEPEPDTEEKEIIENVFRDLNIHASGKFEDFDIDFTKDPEKVEDKEEEKQWNTSSLPKI
jgi:hypothetical protein